MVDERVLEGVSEDEARVRRGVERGLGASRRAAVDRVLKFGAAVLRVEREGVSDDAEALVLFVEEDRGHWRLVEGMGLVREFDAEQGLLKPRGTRGPDAVGEIRERARRKDLKRRLGRKRGLQCHFNF